MLKIPERAGVGRAVRGGAIGHGVDTSGEGEPAPAGLVHRREPRRRHTSRRWLERPVAPGRRQRPILSAPALLRQRKLCVPRSKLVRPKVFSIGPHPATAPNHRQSGPWRAKPCNGVFSRSSTDHKPPETEPSPATDHPKTGRMRAAILPCFRGIRDAAHDVYVLVAWWAGKFTSPTLSPHHPTSSGAPPRSFHSRDCARGLPGVSPTVPTNARSRRGETSCCCCCCSCCYRITNRRELWPARDSPEDPVATKDDCRNDDRTQDDADGEGEQHVDRPSHEGGRPSKSNPRTAAHGNATPSRIAPTSDDPHPTSAKSAGRDAFGVGGTYGKTVGGSTSRAITYRRPTTGRAIVPRPDRRRVLPPPGAPSRGELFLMPVGRTTRRLRGSWPAPLDDPADFLLHLFDLAPLFRQRHRTRLNRGTDGLIDVARPEHLAHLLHRVLAVVVVTLGHRVVDVDRHAVSSREIT